MKSLAKLNLGCGKDYRQGWVNVDVVASLKPDIVHDLAKPLPFANESFSNVLAQDILEHFTKETVREVVGEIYRVLATGGVLEVRVPNVNDIIERFADDEDTRNEFLYGTTLETGIFGAHKQGFSALSLVTLMEQYGLSFKELRLEQTNFVAKFAKAKPKSEVRTLCYVNQTLGLGGAEVFMTDLLVGLRKFGWQVKVGTNFQPFAQMARERGLPVQRFFNGC